MLVDSHRAGQSGAPILEPSLTYTKIMLSPPSSASSSIMDHNRAAAGSSSRGGGPFPGQTSSSYYPPTSGAADYYSNSSSSINNPFTQPPPGAAVGAPEPSPPPSLLGQAAAGPHAASSSFTSTWITPASTEELAAAGDDDGDSFADTEFVYENGRRYHAPASGRVVYPLPNDESEQERDDMKHKLALWMMHEKLLYAPVDEVLGRGGMVLDLGMLSSPQLSSLFWTPGALLFFFFFSNSELSHHRPFLKGPQWAHFFFLFLFLACDLPGCRVSPTRGHLSTTPGRGCVLGEPS